VRTGFTLTRLIRILVCVAIAAAVFLSLRACFNSVRPDASHIGGRVDDSIVALADGSVLIARPGTISRTVIDWFNDKKAPPKTFDIGWQAFQPGSIEPAAESQVRLERFAGEMRANHEVTAKLLVCTLANDAASVQLAGRRANRLMQMLVADRIEPARLSAVTCRLPNARANSSAPSSQDGENIRLVLEH
jgi:hypothetical protein